MQKLIPPILLVVLSFMMIALHFIIPVMTLFFAPLNYLGLIFILIGLTIALKVALSFRKIGTEIHTFKKPNHLVTSGIFKYSRNPIYLSFTLILFGLGIILGSLSVHIVILAYVVISNIWYIPFEERFMEMEFGETYRDYKGKVRRWI